MRPTWTLVIALAMGCEARVPDHGTFVGNPGASLVALATAKSLAFTDLELADGLIVPVDCAGSSGDSVPFSGIDLETPLVLPAGEWCELGVVFGGDTRVLADGTSGGTLDMSLELVAFDLESVASVDLSADHWVLELATPGWLSAEALGVTDGTDAVIGPHDPQGEAAADLVRDTSSLFRDDDRDGVISDEERGAGPAMSIGSGR